ncbi:lanthionine synthetase C family protein [Streptomyces sp. NPDC006654]|uniref:lanthionine synthetase C family protein n=1 Tax=Streptomyces sp. NPDC006654 TaxID=3156897 RepID=UPI0033D2A967
MKSGSRAGRAYWSPPDASQVVAEVARRLAVPDTVRRIALAPGNLDSYRGRPPRPPWEPSSLIEGFPGVSLLHAELGRNEPRARAVAHAHLAATGPQRWSPRLPTGLYGGPTALAFAARAAAHSASDYASLLSRLDQSVLARARFLLDAAAPTPSDAAGDASPVRPAASGEFDVLSGLSGIGRYLLGCRPDHGDVLEEVLAGLVRLGDPVRVGGHEVPGWWTGDTPASRSEPVRGHFAVGMAHGVAGPLALLALAERDGTGVAGAGRTAERMAEWLLSWRQWDEAGPFWPATVTLHEQLTGRLKGPSQPRAGWCHGSPGISRALYLAGRAFGRPAWTQAALDSLTAALVRALSLHPVDNTGLCHGWAGLLRITQLMARDTGEPDLHSQLGTLADAVMRRFRPETPFGFALSTPGEAHLAADRAGFLEGAAGTALALHAYSQHAAPATGWDTALLID